MTQSNLSKGPLSLKVLATMMLLGIALTYAILALHIYIDTEFKPGLIGEAYSTFEWIELTDQTHNYFPYYGIFIFAFALIIFVLGTGYSEKLKIFFSVFAPVMIVIDIGSMWAIPYIHAAIFGWVLFFAGNFLALCFGALFILTLYDIWLKKA
ncbi:hypothetical protein HQ585_11040 [candidate division KSB1 bacterium]|nr:hypothetical protein [candidate division KSB1 bacterium]